MTTQRKRQAGFTMVELIITMCIIAVLAAVAIKEMREYTLRAKVSEVVMATGNCKSTISESFLFLDEAPDPGDWGCESKTGRTAYAGAIETSENGVIRVTVRSVDPRVNGRFVHLVPARGGAALTADDIGNPVRSWICGSDWSLLRAALPGNCRIDTTTWASQDFE
jgi:type IV pilus assembly protein PilA